MIALPILCFGIAAAADWERIQQIPSSEQLRVERRSGNTLLGNLERWSVDALVLSIAKDKTLSVAKPEVSRVIVVRKGRRGRNALIGALVGFGVGFPIGMATAGYVGDTNNPRAMQRLENAARFGAFGAGVGALVGALVTRNKEEVLYTAP